MPVHLKEVQSRKDLVQFIRFPFMLYRANPYWVPALEFDELNTLHWEKNPAFECCQARYWLAYQDGQPVGRVAAILNRAHAEKWGQPYLRFGWLDFVDDPEVSRALFGAVEAWARECGLIAVHGPLGFTDLDREGMLVEGFDQIGTLSTYYNHPYYPAHMESLGYAKDTDWVEYEITVPPVPDASIARAAEIVLRRNRLRVLDVPDKNALLPYARQLFDLINDEYSHLYGTVPLSERQVDAYVKQYFGFITPGFVPIVLDENDRMVAFGIAMPSLSRALQRSRGRLFPFGFIHFLRAMKKNDRADLYLVAVRSEYQGRGVNAVLIHKMNEAFNRMGVTRVESNPELETNRNVQSQWKFFQRRQHKRRRCYIKHLV